MRPYVERLMDDLRSTRLRIERLQRDSSTPARVQQTNYDDRRARHLLARELRTVQDHERDVQREFRHLGVAVGDVMRGEMLFPCKVDNRDAYFVWFEGEDRPTHWRFRGEPTARAVPEWWFTLFLDSKKRRAPQSR